MLGGTPLTLDIVSEALKTALNLADLSIVSHKESILGEGKGFCSNIIRLEIEWGGVDAAKAPKSIVAKVPVVQKMNTLMESNEAFGEMAAIIPTIHNKVYIETV